MYFYMNANFYSYYNVIFWDSNTLYSKLHVASTIWITWVIRDVIDQNSVINCLFARQNFQKMRRYSLHWCDEVLRPVGLNNPNLMKMSPTYATAERGQFVRDLL